MVISTSQKLRHQPIKYLNVKIGDDCIENVNSHKILGIVEDHRLNWSIQINNIAKKANIGTVALRRIGKLIPSGYIQVFANSCIIRHFDYFAYSDAYLYNQLPQSIKQARSVEQFKFLYKNIISK